MMESVGSSTSWGQLPVCHDVHQKGEFDDIRYVDQGGFNLKSMEIASAPLLTLVTVSVRGARTNSSQVLKQLQISVSEFH